MKIGGQPLQQGASRFLVGLGRRRLSGSQNRKLGELRLCIL